MSTTQSVSSRDRFTTSTTPCPICHGWERMQRGHSERCTGYYSTDREFAFCSREEYAGKLEPHPTADPTAYMHKLYGSCNCGEEHNPARPAQDRKQDRRVEKEYPYYDGERNLLFKTIRYTPKDFSQAHLENGKWIHNLKGVTRVLYRLPELLESDKHAVVCIPAGEKDVDNVRRLGMVATCNPLGEGKWQATYNEPLRGRHVALLPHNDEAGENHVTQIAKSLKGVAASVCIVHLQGLPDGGDVSDWLASGGTRKQLEHLIKEAQEKQCPKPTVSRLRDLQREELPETNWAVPEILPEGLTLLGGKTKLGKSHLALAILEAISSGGVVLGTYPVEQGEVLYLDLENGKKRLKKRANNLLHDELAHEDFYYATKWPRLNEGGLEAIEEWLDEHSRARIICIDTWARFKPKAQARFYQQYDEDYDALSFLQELAEKRGVSILVIDHLRKMESEDPIDTISGSVGKAGAVDGFLLLYRKRGESDARLFVCGRDMEEEERELLLTYSKECSSWVVKGDAADSSVAATPQRQEILDELAKHPEKGITLKDLVSNLKKNPNTTRNLLAALRKEGKVQLKGNYYGLMTSNHSNHSNHSQPGNPGNPVDSLPEPSQNGHSSEVTMVTMVTRDSHFSPLLVPNPATYDGDFPPPPDKECIRCGKRDWRKIGKRWQCACILEEVAV